MANFFNLVKVQFLSLFSVNKLLNSKKRGRNFKLGGVGFLLLVIAGVVAGIGYVYSNTFLTALKSNGSELALAPVMIGLSAILSFALTFYTVGSSLFGFKDYDMLSSMPIKPLAIVLSKFFFMYIVDFAFCVLITVPALIVLLTNGVILNATYILSVVVACFTSPLLPLALATVVGMMMYYISSRFKRKNIVQTILLIIVSLCVFGLSFASGFISQDDTASLTMITDVIGKTYFIMPLLLASAVNPLMILAFAGVNLGAGVIVISFVCLTYKKLNSIFTAKRTSRKFKLKEYGANGLDKTLFNKELRRLFSCPAYAVNSLMGAMLTILTAAGYSVLSLTLKAQLENDPIFFVVFEILNRMMPVVFAFMFLMTPTTVSSISIEGQALWIIKTSPVPFKKICFAKLHLNTLFGSLPALVSAVVIACCTGMTVYDGVLLSVIAIAISQVGGLFGLLINLRFPKLDWKTEMQAVKQGLATTFTVLSAFASAIILGVTAYFLRVSITALFGIIAGVFTILGIALFITLIKKGEKLFNKIN